MRARIVLTLPPGAEFPAAPPPAPTVLLEDGAVGVFTTDWEQFLPDAALETVTEQQVRRALGLPREAIVVLSPPLDVPESDLYSGAFLAWRQEAWRRAAAEVIPAPLALAS